MKLASLMDHAPGQRQFAKLEAYAIYYKGKLKMSDEVFRAFCERRIANRRRTRAANRARDRGCLPGARHRARQP